MVVVVRCGMMRDDAGGAVVVALRWRGCVVGLVGRGEAGMGWGRVQGENG